MFWERFDDMCNKNGTRPNPLCKSIGIASGTVTSWKYGKLPNGENLIKIANCLRCSIDYLLGRTDNPNITYENIHSSNIVNGSNGDNSPLTVNEIQQDEMTTELVKAFKKLDFADKMEIMNTVLEKTKK